MDLAELICEHAKSMHLRDVLDRAFVLELAYFNEDRDAISLPVYISLDTHGTTVLRICGREFKANCITELWFLLDMHLPQAIVSLAATTLAKEEFDKSILSSLQYLGIGLHSVRSRQKRNTHAYFYQYFDKAYTEYDLLGGDAWFKEHELSRLKHHVHSMVKLMAMGCNAN